MVRLIVLIFVLTLGGCGTDNHHFDNAYLFENGCLNQDMMQGYAQDIKCIDKNQDGCVTREEWKEFMEYWRYNIPEPGVPLCEQRIN